MTSIDDKVIGLPQPGHFIQTLGSGLESGRFRVLDLPAQETLMLGGLLQVLYSFHTHTSNCQLIATYIFVSLHGVLFVALV